DRASRPIVGPAGLRVPAREGARDRAATARGRARRTLERASQRTPRGACLIRTAPGPDRRALRAARDGAHIGPGRYAHRLARVADGAGRLLLRRLPPPAASQPARRPRAVSPGPD